MPEEARSAPRRKLWGWGRDGEGLGPAEIEDLRRLLAARFGLAELALAAPPDLGEIDLRPPRVPVPTALAGILGADPAERAAHTHGKSFTDLARGLRRDYASAPDLVARPRDEAEVAAVLDWCAAAAVVAVPYGGGSSVVGGVEPRIGHGHAAAVSIDMGALDRVIEVDPVSRSALIQAGVLGPALEDQLRPHGLTLRHYPQSFEHSSLGGWIATRAGGHYATLHTRIDDAVQGLRAVTPRGVMETRRLPGDGAGPQPERLLLGSEGTLGVITEAWMRLQARPQFRASTSVRFSSWTDAVAAARALAQSGLHPSNCRLLDHREALVSGSGDGSAAILILTFESADHPLDAWMGRALEIVREHRGEPDEARRTDRRERDAGREDAAAAWRRTFLRGGHLRDALVRLGLVTETFETAVTWDRFDALHAAVVGATEAAVAEVCGLGLVTCRLAFVYPDGPAPYYTVIAAGRPGAEVEQWRAIKAVASDAIIAGGGTITHHHAVGRDHRPWYDRQRPPLFADALRAAKRALDPAWIMNPGVLIDPD
ncbi:MAG TPA: FAD-binding oxidoreductase [Candidatus Dormibacteraeota bacterium]|jgi:alkyldihydroxyacetonephosphate synthase|nr:FAD-binding oxidoreductase [Candidatus Dormibacteraeota bacterium]